MAVKAATTALVVAARAAIDRCSAGNSVPPLVPQGGHRERRPTGTEDRHQPQAGTCRVFRTLLRVWQARRDAAEVLAGVEAAGEGDAARGHPLRARPGS